MYRQMFWSSPDKPRVHQLGVVDGAGELHLVDRRRPGPRSPIAIPDAAAAATA
jgi:hypothetical protein